MENTELCGYKCPNCGASLQFDAPTQKLLCPSCDGSYEIDDVLNYARAEEQLKSGSSFQWENTKDARAFSDEEAENLHGFVCPSCGGEVIVTDTTAATRCPYCDNDVIAPGRLSGVDKPDLVIPFQITREQAIAALSRFCEKKPLLPKFFKSKNRVESIKGIYVPFWLYSCEAQAYINYRATRVRHWSDSRYNYTETSHYAVMRGGDIAFSNVPVDGSQKMDDDYMEAIEPYDVLEAKEFTTAYLTGYLADKYDYNSEACEARANERIQKSTEDMFASTLSGYSSFHTTDSSIRFTNGLVRYALMPVWLLNTRYKDEIYTFAMNAQSGRFVGRLPISNGRTAAWIAGIFSALTAISATVLLFVR